MGKPKLRGEQGIFPKVTYLILILISDIVSCFISKIPEQTYNLVIFKGNIVLSSFCGWRKLKPEKVKDFPGALHQGNYRARNRIHVFLLHILFSYCNLKNEDMTFPLASTSHIAAPRILNLESHAEFQELQSWKVSLQTITSDRQQTIPSYYSRLSVLTGTQTTSNIFASCLIFCQVLESPGCLISD